MVFVAFGLNHKTAPLSIREKLAVSTSKQSNLLQSLVDQPMVHEAAILSTCNRTEIYCDTNEPEQLEYWLSQQHQLSPNSLSPYLYQHVGNQGIRHTLRVASGLDSMMLGEPQILGQMKQAYQHALHLGTIKKNLGSVFQYIFSASKRIRSLSGIGTNSISIAYAAVQLIGKFFNDYSSLTVFIIGSGETSSLVAKYLHKEGVKNFFIASRTPEHASHLAQAFNGIPLSSTDIPQYLQKADVIISATACPLPFINQNLVSQALSQRNNQPLFFLDLAVPRDIEPNVAELDNVQLFNIDDLQKMIDKGMKERKAAAIQAEQLIENELDNYIRWRRSLRAKKIICSYRDHVQQLAQQELERAQEKLELGHHQSHVMSEFCKRLVNKLLHHPSVGLRQAAWDGQEDLLELAHYLFSLPNESIYL